MEREGIKSLKYFIFMVDGLFLLGVDSPKTLEKGDEKKKTKLWIVSKDSYIGSD